MLSYSVVSPTYVKHGEKYIGAILELSGTALIPFLVDLNAVKGNTLVYCIVAAS